jgi:hypothetical protein
MYVRAVQNRIRLPMGLSLKCVLVFIKISVWQVNEISSDALLDSVHKLYRGVLYFQNAFLFPGTRVNAILFTPIKRARPSLP